MDWIPLCVVLALSLTSQAFECPTGPGCNPCWVHDEGRYQIDCFTSNNSVFKVSIRPGDHIQLTCPDSANWMEFNLGVTSPVKRVNNLIFSSCDLPKGKDLVDIARQLLTDDVERLSFESHKNFSSTLPKNFLRGFEGLKGFTLRFNGLSQLPEDLLAGLENLTFLNLENNDLDRIPEKFFSVPKLTDVEIGFNKIETLASTTFDKLTLVRSLKIWNNKLVEIRPNTFDKLVSLRALEISQNDLKTLPSDIFEPLVDLKFINLSRNNFATISLAPDLFRKNIKLGKVYLFENKRNMTTLPNGFFANLTELQVLKIHRNGFTSLPEDLFWGSRNLSHVNLTGNYLSTLPSNIFKDNKALSKLDLSFNNLSYLPDDVFESQGSLWSLDLSENHLTNISDKLFSSLYHLYELNMEHNNLVTIDIEAFIFMQRLTIAKFSYNSLNLRAVTETDVTDFEPLSPFARCSSLQNLQLMHNNITDIFDDWLELKKLQILNLSHNQLNLLKDSDLNFEAEHLNVDLTYNNISHVDLSRVEIWATKRTGRRIVIVSIENNPIQCDCKVYDLLRYMERRFRPNVVNVFELNIGALKCVGPRDFQNISVANLNSRTFKCETDDPESQCPDRCDCYLRPANQAFVINCAYKGLSEAPLRLITSPYRPIELNLTGNLLTEMPIFGLSGWDKVTILALDHNQISLLKVYRLPSDLQVLQLHNNNITKATENGINYLRMSSSLTKLTLAQNPWSCDCEAKNLLKYILYKRAIISDLQNVTCFGSKRSISTLTPSDICPEGTGWIIGGCLVVAFLGMIIGTLAALYYRYQREIKVWLYARQWCLWLVTEDELDKDKLYDAFISFSHKDEDFVVNELVSKLEEGPRPFKLCIHYRDWLAGEFIPKQIARSVADSRRTIVVLSPNFLESVWGRMEFRAAHSQALNEGRARVIVILYGDIGPTDDLDPELKAYLSMNTYVKWDDPWFWEKLKYALPHSPEFRRDKMRRKIIETPQPRVSIENEKSELISPPVAYSFNELLSQEKEC